MILSILVCLEHIRFSHVMKQHRQTQHLIRRNAAQRDQRMFPRRINVVRIVLALCHDPVKLRHNDSGNPRLIRHLKPVRTRRSEELHQFRLNPLRTDIGKISRHSKDGILRIICQCKSKLCCEPHGTHHAQRILTKALLCVSHTADGLFFNICKPAKFIHQSRFRRIRHRIDRKISAPQILRQASGKNHVFRMTAVLIIAVDPICRHLKAFFSIHNCHGSVLDSSIDRARK